MARGLVPDLIVDWVTIRINKMGTKNNPGKFDCYKEAEDDEPIFTLLARDELAPTQVRQWAYDYSMKCGHDPLPEQNAKANEAYAVADAMEKWRREHGFA